MWFSVCVCDFVPSDPDPKESRACEALDKVCVCVCVHFSQERSWAEAGWVTRGRREKTRGGGRKGGSERWCSRSKNSAASIPLLPPTLPSAIPPSPSSISSSSLSLMKKGLQVHGGEGLRCYYPQPAHPSFHGERSAWGQDRPESRGGGGEGRDGGREGEGKQRGCACLLTNCSCLTSRLQMPAHVSSLRDAESH